MSNYEGNATNASNKAASKDKNKYSKQKPKNCTWKIGSKCRAIYTGDGLEYEATVSYIDGEDCVVTFIGESETGNKTFVEIFTQCFFINYRIWKWRRGQFKQFEAVLRW